LEAKYWREQKRNIVENEMEAKYKNIFVGEKYSGRIDMANAE
jgi:hypothetical protein